MARRQNKHLRPVRPLSVGGAGSGGTEQKRDGRWVVRTVSGQAATKSYTCPGCGRPIPPGTPHVVAWSTDEGFGAVGVAGRRHWHRGCWQRRA